MTALRIAGSLTVLLWSIAGAVYSVMAYTPFTKIQFLDSQVIPAVGTLAGWHGVLAWLALVAGLAALKAVVGRTTLVVVATVGVVGAAALTVWPVLPGLGSEPRTLLWCAAFLLPSITLGAVLTHRRLAQSTTSGVVVTPEAVTLAVFPAAFVCWSAGLAVAAQRMTLLDAGPVAGVALAVHVVLFGTAAAVLVLVVTIFTGRRSQAAAILALATALTTAVVYAWVFRGINFTGPPALAIASIMGLALVIGRPMVGLRSAAMALGLLLTAGVASVWVQAAIAPLDWNFLGQRVATMVLWAIAFSLATVATARIPSRRWMVPVVLGGVLVVAGALRVAQARVDSAATAQWATVDPSFAAVLDLAPARRSGMDTAIFTFLQAHTGLPRGFDIQPYDVAFTSALTARTEALPNIFVFVIDSLRQDYLGAYDPDVDFTPALNQFAADSLVFRQAFSRYGATGLSQPSLWVGGIMPHKQYIQPFAPMNALEKLLRVNGYDVRVSYDIISHQILLPTTPDEDLDEGVQNMDYRLCSTLTRLTTSLAARSDRPVFVFTMPQDVHVSTLSREGNSAVDGNAYGDKFAPYASRVRRLDACFGTFIASLKAMGLYDESVIVFTADHGDSLGEGGRWGHAYTIFPEILRVPLVIKLPRSHDGRWASRVNEIAFTTDVTPTLYRLLGYEVTSDDRFFGVPLIGTAGRLPARTPRHLAASSYGPVYAVFDNAGDSLYILDAVNYRDHLFRLGTGPGADREVTATPSEQADYQAFMRLRLSELHALYGVKDKP